MLYGPHVSHRKQMGQLRHTEWVFIDKLPASDALIDPEISILLIPVFPVLGLIHMLED